MICAGSNKKLAKLKLGPRSHLSRMVNIHGCHVLCILLIISILLLVMSICEVTCFFSVGTWKSDLVRRRASWCGKVWILWSRRCLTAAMFV